MQCKKSSLKSIFILLHISFQFTKNINILLYEHEYFACYCVSDTTQQKKKKTVHWQIFPYLACQSWCIVTSINNSLMLLYQPECCVAPVISQNSFMVSSSVKGCYQTFYCYSFEEENLNLFPKLFLLCYIFRVVLCILALHTCRSVWLLLVEKVTAFSQLLFSSCR